MAMLEKSAEPATLCPRCQQARICRPEAIAACPCTSIRLSPNVQAYLAQHYSACLCLACLQAIAQQHVTTNDRKGKNSQLRDPHF